MDLTVVTATTDSPVSLDEAKSHLNVTNSNDDALIVRKVKAATRYCQSRIPGHKQFMKATYDGVMGGFPADRRITLPLPPLQSITSIKYYNSTGSQVSSTGGSTSWSSTHWDMVNPTEGPGYIEPAYGKTWPVTRRRIDAVTIRFTAGSTSAQQVPEDIRAAVLLKTEHLWDPERVKVSEIDEAIDDLLGGADYGHYG